MLAPIPLHKYLADLLKGAREDHKLINTYGALALAAIIWLFRHQYEDGDMHPAVNLLTAALAMAALFWGMLNFFILRPHRKLNEALAAKEAAEAKLKPKLSIVGLPFDCPLYLAQECYVLVTNESAGERSECVTVELEFMDEYYPSVRSAEPPFILIPEPDGEVVLNPGQNRRFGLFHVQIALIRGSTEYSAADISVKMEKKRGLGAYHQLKENKVYRLKFKVTAHNTPPTHKDLFLVFVCDPNEGQLMAPHWRDSP